jgi:hypothetical protein
MNGESSSAAARRRMRDFSPGFEPLFVTEEGEEPPLQFLDLEFIDAETDKNSDKDSKVGVPISSKGIAKASANGYKILTGKGSSTSAGEKNEARREEIQDESEESQSESQSPSESKSSTSSSSSSASANESCDCEEGDGDQATDKTSECSGTETASTVVVVVVDRPASKKSKSTQDDQAEADEEVEEARPHKLQKMSSFDFKKKCT